RNIDICIGALKPLIMAAEEIHYNDIFDVLKSIEQPLVAFRQGKKRLLSKKDVRNISTDYKELTRLISRSVAADTLEISMSGVRSTTPASALGAPANLMVSDLLAYFKDINPEDMQKLFAVGLTKLGDLAYATTREIQDSTGLDHETAERLKLCANNAIAGMSLNLQRSSGEVQRMENTRQTSSLERDHIGSAEEVSPPSVPDLVRERWISAVERLNDELDQYTQAAISVADELERSHRVLTNVRVARERFRGEVEFYQDDLADLFDRVEPVNEELGTPVSIHRQMLKNLRRTLDHIGNALKKAEVIYSQIDETLEETQELEMLLLSLRKRKSTIISRTTGVRRRTDIDQQEQGTEEQLPKRLN
ncbi:MAG: hypothetical protein QW828_07580, partial [Candidatus Bathyarchaeia archaeon]